MQREFMNLKCPNHPQGDTTPIFAINSQALGAERRSSPPLAVKADHQKGTISVGNGRKGAQLAQ